jgi:hypothetical protein
VMSRRACTLSHCASSSAAATITNRVETFMAL